MDTKPVFLVQIEAKPDLIGQTDLFCYSVNKFHPGSRVIVVCEQPVAINRPNTQISVIANNIYPEINKKYLNKNTIAIKRVTYIKEFLSTNKLDNNFVIMTDPDVAFVKQSSF